MPSPFPGMDPYLRHRWVDIRLAMLAEARRTLNRLLPDGLVARIGTDQAWALRPSDHLQLVVRDMSGARVSWISFAGPTPADAADDRPLPAGLGYVRVELFAQPVAFASVRLAGGERGARRVEMPLRVALPDVRLPLRVGDHPVMLPLQSLLTAAYDSGRYQQSLDYTRPPDPPLDPDDAAWAAALLAGRSH